MKRKRLLAWALTVAIVAMMFPICGITAFATVGTWSGSGTSEDDPLLIETVSQFMEISTYNDENSGYTTKYFKLANNLDFTGVTTYTPIGTSTKPFKAFFDGNGKEISNLTVTGLKVGIFSYVSSATIKNLTLRSGTITDTGTDINTRTAGIVADAAALSSIINCNNYASITGFAQVGGIVGYANKSVINGCYNEGTISGTSTSTSYGSVGGIVGKTEVAGTRIINCHNAGNLVNKSSNTGGIVGYDVSASEITNCYNSAEITVTTIGTAINGCVGGIVGLLSTTGKVDSCYNTGAFNTASARVGGIVGKSSGQIINCYNTNNITNSSGRGNIAGIVGELTSATALVRNCYNTGNISTQYDAGGIACTASSGAIISDCYNTGNVVGTSNGSGGIACSISGTTALPVTVVNSYSSGNTSKGCFKNISTANTYKVFNLYYNNEKGTTSDGVYSPSAITFGNDAFGSGKVAALLNKNHVGTDLTQSPASIWSNDNVNPIFADNTNYPVYEYIISGVGSNVYTEYVKFAPATQMNVIVASYDVNNSLVDVSTKVDAPVKGGSFTAKEGFVIGTNLKIMFWEGFNNLKPLCNFILK